MAPTKPIAPLSFSQHSLGIIADDLTGATDAAVPFARAGFETRVVLQRSGLTRGTHGVLALTTNSRHDPPATARRKVRAACRFLQRQGVALLYKKLDSTVQGNIVAEAETLRDTTGCQTVLFCPSNPSQGRVVRHGVLKVRGKPVTRLAEHLAGQGLRHSVALERPVTPRRVSRLLRSAPPFVIADAENERDLAVLVRGALEAPQSVLLAGSAGMAALLAKFLGRSGCISGRESVAGDTQGLRSERLAAPPLVFCGSRNGVTQKQLDALTRLTEARRIGLTRRTAKAIREALGAGHPVVVDVPVHLEPEAVLLDRLRSMSDLLEGRRIGSLVVTGGDTALLICRWLRPQAMVLRGELLPGLPWGVLSGGRADGMVVCTKPGGFGTERSLVSALRLLSPRRR